VHLLIELGDPVHLALNLVTVGICCRCATYVVRHGSGRRDRRWLILGVFANGVYLPIGPVMVASAVAKRQRGAAGAERTSSVERRAGGRGPR
jgi:hypothetical protein